MKRVCSVDGCSSPHVAHGWCLAHVKKWRKYGDPLARAIVPSEVWMNELVASPPTDECVLWPFARNHRGYGVVTRRNGRNRQLRAAHLILERAGRSRPSAASISLHSCDNPPCVNPAHLSWGTQSDNQRQRWERTGWRKGDKP